MLLAVKRIKQWIQPSCDVPPPLQAKQSQSSGVHCSWQPNASNSGFNPAVLYHQPCNHSANPYVCLFLLMHQLLLANSCLTLCSGLSTHETWGYNPAVMYHRPCREKSIIHELSIAACRHRWHDVPSSHNRQRVDSTQL